ncbi:MAG: hypothetical protein IT558_00780 [Alphaproteobacteria bacterium]|nr:hypothetical protein [Alphaproteobacteria bacterium]
MTMNVAPPTDYLLTITSAVPNTQPITITNLGGFFPAIINAALDRATIIVQQVLSRVNRSIKIPISDGTSITTELPTAALRANKALIFDEDGNITVSVDDFDGNSAAEAAASAVAAESYATAAAASAAQAATLLDNFDDRYLGQKAADPTLDNDGNALIDGALYYNTTSNVMKVYDLGTTTWLAIDLDAKNFKVSSNDTTPGFIEDKLLVSGSPLTLSTQNDGGNETRTITLNIASQGEAEAGSATDKVMTPQRTSQAISALGASYKNNGYATNRYYFGFGAGPLGGTKTVTANRLYYRPLIICASETFTRVGLRVNTLSAGNARIGLYNFANGVPTTRVADFGTVDTGTTGLKEITISQALTPGVYAIAVVFDATPTVNCHNESGLASLVELTGQVDHSNGTGVTAGGYGNFTYAALPSNFPAITDQDELLTDLPGTWIRKV